MLEIGKARVFIEAKKPDGLWFGQIGKSEPGDEHKILDWIQLTIERVRGL